MFSVMLGDPSEQPDVGEEQDDGGEEAEPDLPPDAGPLGHEEHAVHGAAEAQARLVERVVHLLGQGARVADLVADRRSHLFQTRLLSVTRTIRAPLSLYLSLSPFHSRRDGERGRGGKGGREGRGGQLTSFSTLTLPRMPATCASFWLSSSLSTASLYWPLLLGVAER